jgi:hypothetical protein
VPPPQFSSSSASASSLLTRGNSPFVVIRPTLDPAGPRQSS